MAVHLPLSAEAQAEARILMLSSNNILKPAACRPVTMPTQDMIIGLFHLTSMSDKVNSEGKALGEVRRFSCVCGEWMAYGVNELGLMRQVLITLQDGVPSYCF